MSDACALGPDAADFVYADLAGVYTYGADGKTGKSPGLVQSTYGNTYGVNDVIGVAFDADNGDLYFYKNGTIQNSGTAAFTGLDMTDGFYPAVGYWGDFTFNFGQRAFDISSIPSGYSALNTSNLPAPTVKDGSQYFDTVLWTGNGTTQTITGVGFQSDFVWVKSRSGGVNHLQFDAVRGFGSGKELSSDNTNVEGGMSTNLYGYVSGVGSDSISVVAGTSGANYVNYSATTYVAWNWLASNTSGSSNTDGSITSTVSANPTAGFSIVTYTGNGTAGATVGHGLGVAPAFFVVKSRSHAHEWIVYHKIIGATKYLVLQDRNSAGTYTPHWNDTEPTSTVFTVGTAGDVNGSSKTFVAYCFAEVESYSKFGSYTGNGSASDGPFVYCGFRPAMVIIKNITTTLTNWIIRDSARSPYNQVSPSLYPNLGDAEINNFPMDFLSNGFKIRDDNGVFNTSGNDYVFMCFAENPFGGSGVSPATAR